MLLKQFLACFMLGGLQLPSQQSVRAGLGIGNLDFVHGAEDSSPTLCEGHSWWDI